MNHNDHYCIDNYGNVCESSANKLKLNRIPEEGVVTPSVVCNFCPFCGQSAKSKSKCKNNVKPDINYL
jgi:hypothetical protein